MVGQVLGFVNATYHSGWYGTIGELIKANFAEEPRRNFASEIICFPNFNGTLVLS